MHYKQGWLLFGDTLAPSRHEADMVCSHMDVVAALHARFNEPAACVGIYL